MNAGELIDALHRAGATLVIESGKARVRGARIPDELMAELKAQREGVLAEWQRRQGADLDRYGTLPLETVPLFGRDARATPDMRSAVIGYVMRQPRTIHAWVMHRLNDYKALGLPVEDQDWRACVDVLAWQRNTDGQRALEWLEGIEACVTDLQKPKPEKTDNKPTEPEKLL